MTDTQAVGSRQHNFLDTLLHVPIHAPHQSIVEDQHRAINTSCTPLRRHANKNKDNAVFFLSPLPMRISLRGNNIARKNHPPTHLQSLTRSAAKPGSTTQQHIPTGLLGIQLNIVGGEQARRSTVVTIPPILVGKLEVRDGGTLREAEFCCKVISTTYSEGKTKC